MQGFVKRDTLQTYEESLRLTSRSNEVGVASALDVSQARTAVEGARANLARYQRQLAQDQDALVLLLGTGLPANLLQASTLSTDLIAAVQRGCLPIC